MAADQFRCKNGFIASLRADFRRRISQARLPGKVGGPEERNARDHSAAGPQARDMRDSAKDSDATIDVARQGDGKTIPTRSAASKAGPGATSRPGAGKRRQRPTLELKDRRVIRRRKSPVGDNPAQQKRSTHPMTGFAAEERLVPSDSACEMLRVRYQQC